MSTPTPPKKSNKKLGIALLLVAVSVGVLLMPVLVYGGFTVPVRRITFGETTGSLTPTSATAQVNVEMQNVYEYMFVTRTSARVRTSESNMQPAQGTTNITIRLQLTTPSNQTIDLGNVNISGSIGTRNHTLYLGVDEGVRVPGSYHLDIIITATVTPIAGIQLPPLTVTVTATFTVS
mgnify:CR=1 FL=1